jgi:predicted negative regulator of RcsB-dependent stress response
MVHKRQVSWALLALAVAIGGIWYLQRSRSLREQHAERAYFQARQSANAGNLPLAVSDLKKVVTRYEGTRGGTQAAIFLAQSLYEQKNHKEGIAELKKALPKASEDFVPSIHVLVANGHEELKEFGPAAEEYKAAAAATDFPAEKAQHQARAARAYMAAGKPEEAKAIWTELAKDESGPMAAEARVRLGEISARPMSI